ncbi:MAG: CTP synthetase [Candidatus Roizmanbacteria bacterium GW2011_GWC2_37_13]|uniref:CTP synthase (glutamine hydrolyzing) n=1 Tax=Candidatus Roizmanbacteria bacterium GW2011_GWC2_37_13 TaxID=1618486 RepID=A0A0G0G4U3_9BACT|nr:MAG: CTP synthetase [Candidatus Roizmanbacteria bacterium GW2011_GWC1_37_12]KKQ25067.1 MAG: CTP synthetase [Candidatus Roizmanbacteria bacterium GW2011_GWC2_37_13]
MKYIFISGGVISGIGKGITAASISLLLKQSGYRVAPLKFENYLNLDAGTINPIEHGDPFLCEDGAETDMDIGTYEKFLDEDMGKDNFVTIGEIYKTVIDRERRFEYKGEDVEAIPHITNEIIERINLLGRKKKADIVIIELGGTAGEYQNIFYYEASRILTLKNPEDVIHIHVSFVPTPSHLGEPKTKPTQLSVRTLNSMGIQPDFIVARSEKLLDKRRIERFALFCNVQPENIISNPDVPHPYEVPIILENQQIAEKILTKFNLKVIKPNLSAWEKLLKKIYFKKEKDVSIAIVGKYFGTGDYQLRDSYAALFDALDHASWKAGVNLKIHWVNAEKVESAFAKEIIGNVDGLIVPIGWGERGVEGMITAAGFARKEKIPYLGLCYGMQLGSIEFARNVVGLKDANSTEANPKTKNPIIHNIPFDPKYQRIKGDGTSMRLGTYDCIIKPETLVDEIYTKYDAFKNKEKRLISERHRHRFEFNNDYRKQLESKGLVVSGYSPDNFFVEMVELPKSVHPFYIGTQGHPEYKSRPMRPHPIFVAFLKYCL